MLENLLGGLLGTGKRGESSNEEGGIGSLLPLIIIGFVLLGGLKLLAPKKEEGADPLLPGAPNNNRNP